MILSSISVRRPVLAAVLALLLIVLGIGAALRLPVREYPDVDPPVVSVSIVYPGASAEVVERDVTQVVEDNLNAVEGIDKIDSTSRAGFSKVDVEFVLSRDLEAAAADVRDKVSAIRGDLPEEADEPVITKASADAQAMMWITLTSPDRDRRALTDLAIRDLVDPLSVLPGVAQVIIGGQRRYAMRIWLDAQRMAARGITVTDVARTLSSENVELPGGRIEAGPRELTVRTATKLADIEQFRDLVLRDAGGYQVRLGDVAQVELGAESYRSNVFLNGVPAVGLGVVRQSEANTLSVAGAVRGELDRLRNVVPEDVTIDISYDQSIFVEGSIRSVLTTLLITAGLVIVVITLFLGSFKGTLVPAATIPASLIAAFTVLYALDFSINTLTLLALVLAVGLVVDDAIVVLESVVRQREKGRPKLLAAVTGAGEVGLAVIATTAVLVAVLLPISAITGTTGRLFTEFAMTLAAAVVFSSFLALTLGAMLASNLAEPARQVGGGKARPFKIFAASINWTEEYYGRTVRFLAGAGWVAAIAAVVLGTGAYFLLRQLPSELAPTEDRGVFIVPVTAPEGASLEETTAVIDRIEALLEPYRGENGPVDRVIGIVGAGTQGPPQVNSGLAIVKLKPWDRREMGQQSLVEELLPRIVSIPGARAVPINPPSLVSQSFGKPIQFVIQGPDYRTAKSWAETVLAEARQLGSMRQLELEFNERSPRARVEIDRRMAAELGLSVAEIGETLRIFLGGTDITDFYRRGETYEVMVRGREEDRGEPADIGAIEVRTSSGALVPLATVVDIDEEGAAASYRRVDRLPSMVISAVPRPGEDMGSILAELESIAEEELPRQARVAYLGLSEEFQESSADIYVAFGLALIVVYLTLAALFESFVYPVVILFSVPLAITGGLLALYIAGMSFNIFSQIGILLLVGLLAKNAILVVDFANQRRRDGMPLEEAIVGAGKARFRPVVMTSVATLFGAMPLALATGPGSEARTVIGVVVIAGVIGSTLITLLIVPGLYRLFARFGGVPGSIEAELDRQRRQSEQKSEEHSPQP